MQVYKPIRICYLNSLYKHYENVCDYNITFKRIDNIINGANGKMMILVLANYKDVMAG